MSIGHLIGRGRAAAVELRKFSSSFADKDKGGRRSALNQDVQSHVFFPLGISRTEISRTVRCFDHRGQHQFFELVFIVGLNTVINRYTTKMFH
ncbi:hypothetical protein IGI04_013064 [Brassica rapa subsp. trilocularis]|uniref:Uncharacterized protein n=1 Tax=Brassica rapa subsp. trilocularis TaxID=1813537 RepID=A0ABQ7N9R5_BRACM|nr:hypothetical protein IGI04_013064 [Brassica rapa subsp. trilocularis]